MQAEAFDHFIRSTFELGELPIHNLTELIFKLLPNRDEQAEVILSHDGFHLLRITLPEFRSIVFHLYQSFVQKEFRRSDTILLAPVPGNNECFVAILFAALASFGVRVLMPMFTETAELDSWIEQCNCRAVLYPATEILSLQHHKKEKAMIRAIRSSAEKHRLPLYDTLVDFDLRSLIRSSKTNIDCLSEALINETIQHTDEQCEALIITTSGSSGKSKLVVYQQGALLLSCLSWQTAGFFRKERFGGRGFTPLFTHTMGIRSFFNALWSGYPICLLNTEWFAEKPETIRYLLMQMYPEHVTGGPAAFQLLLELMRIFPDLKSELKRTLRTIISSGAPIRSEILHKMESLVNTPVHNAYGTTETQQVLNTLLIPDAKPIDRLSLGAPLPGVTIALKRYSEKNLYRMYVRSPFGCSKIMGDETINISSQTFFNTEDIVRYEKGRLFYVGRETQDFLKDGFGVKVPLPQVKGFYREVLNHCSHIEFFSLLHEPGLGVLIFPNFSEGSRDPGEKDFRTFFSKLLEKINARLYHELDPFVFRHHTIRRFALANEPAPQTAKGSVARQQIKETYHETIAELIGVFPRRESVHILTLPEDTTHPFSRQVNPYQGEMLQELKLDYVYHRGQKDSLFTFRNGQEIEILDMIGGYGTNLLGHNHPQLKQAFQEFLAADRVALANQGSMLDVVGELADRLNGIVGRLTGRNFRVCFGSSGSEIVEMALHHACLEWRRRVERFLDHQNQLFGGMAGDLLQELREYNQKQVHPCKLSVVVSATAFHGHTSAARSLLKRSDKRDAFSNLVPLTPIYVNDQNPSWRATFESHCEQAVLSLKQLVLHNEKIQIRTRRFCTIIAAIFEPVTGEGGIRCVDPEVLRYFSSQDYPLILDEIQCGLGRTGTFLASWGIPGDYYLFAKALGGGLVKIGALLIDASRYQNEFGKYYTSTFANGELAAFLALKVLKLIESEKIPQKAHQQGHTIHHRLRSVQQAFPEVIAGITGKGLMQGIQFADFRNSTNILFRTLAHNNMLGYLFASYLLHAHRIRTFPSLSAANVLRIEPSIFITDSEIKRLSRAIHDLAGLVHSQNCYHLCKHLMDGDEFTDNKGKIPDCGFFYPGLDSPADGAVPITFIGHFAYPVEELRALVKDFCRASDTGLRILTTKIQRLLEMKPVIIFQKNIFNRRIHFTCMILPLDSAILERLHREGKRRKIVAQIQKAVDLAVANGSRVISLGGYTSIFTNNSMAVTAPDSVKIITGNTLTAASGLRRLFQAMNEHGLNRKKCVAAIVGIPGNIGSILAKVLSQRTDRFSKIILIGRTQPSLQHFYHNLQQEIRIPDEMAIQLETDLKCLTSCDVILITTNTNDPILFRHHLRTSEPVLIVDNSVPAAVADEVHTLPNVISLPLASYVTLPYDPDFLISTYTPRGTVFCCAAEAILCALEPVSVPLRGKITVQAVEKITELAEKHGFFSRMGGIESFKAVGAK